MLDDLEHEEQDEKEAGEVAVQEEFAQGSVPDYCVPCQGNVCYCKDKRQVTFFTSDEEYYEELEGASNLHPGGLDDVQQYWSSEDEAVAEDTDSEVPCVVNQLHRVDSEEIGVADDAHPEFPGVVNQLHRV